MIPWPLGQRSKGPLTVGDGDISINNVKDQLNTKMDESTVTLTLKAPVKAGEVKAGEVKAGEVKAGDDQGGVAYAGLKLAVWSRRGSAAPCPLVHRADPNDREVPGGSAAPSSGRRDGLRLHQRIRHRKASQPCP